MTLSEIAQKKILAHLYIEEDYKQFAYDDATDKTVKAPEGFLTFGIGWNIQANGCPREIAEFAAMYYIKQADAALTKAISFYEKLDDVRKVVLCDMAFTMGIVKALGFTGMLSAMQRLDYRAAAICMLNSEWAKKDHSRATKDSAMMESGEWLPELQAS